MTAFLKPDDLPVLERLAASDPTDTIRKRVRLLLLYEAGMKTAEIADKVDLSPGRVLYWRRRYLKDGLGIFGDALDDDGEEKVDRHPKKPKKKNKDGADKKSKPRSLAKLTRAARKARKSDDSTEEARKALAAGIKRASKRRKKLKKSMRRASKKETVRIQDRLKKLNRRIKKAKKMHRKLSN